MNGVVRVVCSCLFQCNKSAIRLIRYIEECSTKAYARSALKFIEEKAGFDTVDTGRYKNIFLTTVDIH